LQPTFAEAHVNLGTLLREQGWLQEAISQFQKAIRSSPNLALAHVNLGNALREQGQLEDAAMAFQAALERQPGLVEPRNGLRDLERVLKPQDAFGHNSLADYLMRQGRLLDAESETRIALRRQPTLAVAHCTLGEILYRQGRSADGDAAFQQA